MNLGEFLTFNKIKGQYDCMGYSIYSHGSSIPLFGDEYIYEEKRWSTFFSSTRAYDNYDLDPWTEWNTRNASCPSPYLQEVDFNW
ncbi:MAG: hypothetical protein NPIRA03_39130 [Nitrospirales bacterium]|nr:MAG: hypothetical protein NPIRA03_39130 [Nitrospirales bacterium]